MVEHFQMRPSDVTFKYNALKYKKISNFLLSTGQLGGADAQFLFALTGFDVKKKIPVATNDGTDDEHSLSRTTFQRDIVNMERNFGLLTIVDNFQEPYNDVLNNKAFLKNADKDTTYLELPNVKNFYEYLIGGIGPVSDIVYRYGDTEADIFDGLYDYLTSSENSELIDSVIHDLAN